MIEEIKNKDNKARVELVGYIPSFEFTTSASGTKSITGVIHNNGSVNFRIWTGDLYDQLKKEPDPGIYSVEATVNDFNGQRSLIINEMELTAETDLTPYVPSPYDRKDLWSRLLTHANTMSPQGRKVFKEIMGACDFEEGVKNSSFFVKSVAALSHHDNHLSGLLAHTVKVLDILTNMVNNYPHLKERINYDVLILGAIIHDIGKVVEYAGFAISDLGKICSHLTLGIEVLIAHKDTVIEELGVEAYFRLQAVITQHHGPFGDTPRAFESYVIHKADMLESTLTSLDEAIEANDTSDQIFYRDGEMRMKLH